MSLKCLYVRYVTCDNAVVEPKGDIFKFDTSCFVICPEPFYIG